MQSWWSSGNTAKAYSRCGRGACDPPDLGTLGIACWKLHKLKKRGEISPAQFADAKLSVVLCYLPLGFVAQGLLQFLQVLRNLQWFIMSYDHLQLLIPKVQHPHSVSCHKIIFISNSKELKKRRYNNDNQVSSLRI